MRDVIVVGAGGGGPVVAKELAARGLDVLLLEAGPDRRRAPERLTRLENDANNPLGGYYRFGPGDRSRPAWRREQPQNSAISQVAGVGGTTQHYFANSPRAMPGVFEGYEGADKDAYDVAHRFPLSYRELLPYYEWVETTLPVGTAPMGTKEEVFFRGAEAMGLPLQTSKDITRAAFRPQQNAILEPRGEAGRTSDPSRIRFPRAQGCTFCGHCNEGCVQPQQAQRNLIAKRSTDVSYVPMALTSDLWSKGGKPITLVPDAFATKVLTDAKNVARGVTWRDTRTGSVQSEEARVVVLACGAIESPRLWALSGLPDPYQQVGAGLTDHFVDAVIGVMPFDTRSSRGPSSAARADFPGRGMMINVGVGPAFMAAILATSDAGIAGIYDNGLPGGAHGADSVGRLVGKQLVGILDNIDRLLGIGVFTDDDVEARNRVMLSNTMPPDEHGAVPRVLINGRQRSKRTVDNREFLVAQAVRLLRGAGATKVVRINTPPWLFHLHSTMRMGRTEQSAVLDPYGEAHHVPRLFVADNSMLSNALGGPNPTLTTQALATRAAERVFTRYFGGDPWVGREAPVPSTHPLVTKGTVLRQL